MSSEFMGKTYRRNLDRTVLDGDLEVTGDLAVTGNLVPEDVEVNVAEQELTATGTITISGGVVKLNHATVVIAATFAAAPTAGDMYLFVDNSASGTAAHTVTLPSGVTWDGTNNTATFNAPNEALFGFFITATRFYIVTNVGSVALTSV